MLIQIRGTSGSGKTTAMRKIMDGRDWQAVTVLGRKKPLYYYSMTEDWPERIAVVGHYESVCGGCDNVGSAPDVYRAIKEIIDGNGVIPILSEGLLWSEDTKWTLALRDEGYDVRPFFLTTPLEQCLRQVKGRREAAGNTKELDPTNTANRIGVIERARVKLTEAGVFCRRVSADQCPKEIRRLLRLHAQRED